MAVYYLAYLNSVDGSPTQQVIGPSTTVISVSSLSSYTPTKSGYAFDYWQDKKGNTYQSSDGLLVSSLVFDEKIYDESTGNTTYQKTLTAYWKKPMTVYKSTGLDTLYSKDGSTKISISSSGTKYEKDCYFDFNTTDYKPVFSTGYTYPVKLYKRISGWSYVSEIEENKTYTISFSDDANYKLEASKITCNITLDPNGGTAGSVTSKTATFGDAMPAITGTGALPTRTGYTFNGYYDAKTDGTQYYKSDGTSAKNWDKTSTSATLYAQWTIKSITYTFYKYDETGKETRIGNYGTQSTAPSSPSRSGYTFNGYYQNDKGKTISAGSQFTFGSTNQTYTGSWTANKYTVTLDRQGGTTGDTSVTATFDSAMPTATMPTRLGYIFGGYFKNSGGTGNQYYTSSGGSLRTWDIANNDTLYAKWTATTNTISYDANGGSNPPASQTKTYDQPLKLRSERPTAPLGKEFIGWAETKSQADEGTAKYQPGDEYTKNITTNTILYAVWKAITYKYKLRVAIRWSGSVIKAEEIINAEAAKTSIDFNINKDIIPKLKRSGCTLTQLKDGSTTYIIPVSDNAKITINAANNNVEQEKIIYSIWDVNFPKFHWSNNFDNLDDIKEGTDAQDNILFQNKLSSDLKAKLWNNFNYQVQLLAGSSSAYQYTPVSAIDVITADTYNHAAAKLYELDNESGGVNPFKYPVTKGEVIKLSYLNNGSDGLLSLKEEANKVREELYGNN